MSKHTWQLLEVEELFHENPDFFGEYPLRSVEDRRSVCEGELVKLAIRILGPSEPQLYRRWTIVNRLLDGKRFVGDLLARPGGRMPPDDSVEIEFGAENIYRMEPRNFVVWAVNGEPVEVTGVRGVPLLKDGSERDDCEPFVCFHATGWSAAKHRYRELASSNGWPELWAA